ncbi:MAG: hypothetical protein JNK05_13250 [Myxococcales bacterium]|nr:hypothetical protein [Myxococcales bacterium]
MHNVGSIIRDTAQRTYQVLQELGEGGQGKALLVEGSNSHRRYIAKVFRAEFATMATVARIERMIAHDLPGYSRAFMGPVCTLHPEDGVGYLMGRAPGRPLQQVLEEDALTLGAALGLALSIVTPLALLERRGIGHGDISANNFIVETVDGGYISRPIDLDNATLPDAPPAPCMGQDLYVAPELATRRASPSLKSDRFAIAVLMSEVLLGRHPFSPYVAADAPYEDYLALVAEGRWPDDPTRGSGRETGRVLANALSQPLLSLFNRAFGRERAERPRMHEWESALRDSLGHVFACASCGNESVNRRDRVRCPWCDGSPPDRGFKLPSGKTVCLEKLVTVLGRADVGDIATVSREHVAITREGFAIVAEALSTNGLMVRTDDRWIRYAKGERVVLAPGDLIYFAEAQIGEIV